MKDVLLIEIDQLRKIICTLNIIFGNLNRCMRYKKNLEDSEVHMKIELYIS